MTGRHHGSARHQLATDARAVAGPTFEELIAELMAAAGRFGHRERADHPLDFTSKGRDTGRRGRSSTTRPL